MNETAMQCPLCHTSASAYATYRLYDYYTCSECQGVFMDPSQHLSPEQERSEYLTHENDVNDLRFQQYVMPVVDLITEEQGPEGEGLDFGAGFAPVITRMLEDRGYHLNLYDPFFHPDTTALHRTYDFIVACEVIEHLYHPQETFLHLFSLLKHGGTLYCRTSLLTDTIDFNQWHYRKEATHVFFYRPQTIHYLAQMIEGMQCSIISPTLCLFRKAV